MGERRKLPVIQSSPGASREDGDEHARPPWQWSVFASVMTFALWLPLAGAAGAVVRRRLDALAGRTHAVEAGAVTWTPEQLAAVKNTMVAAHAVALSLAAFGAGWLVGRFSEVAGPRQAATGASVCVLMAVLLSWVTTGPALAPLLAVAFAAPVAALGARTGKKRGPKH